jgi:ketosteroid isomerase-like protein
MAHETGPEGNAQAAPARARPLDEPARAGETHEVQALLDAFARALVAGDGKGVASLWETPALVIDVHAVIPVSTRAEVEKFFGGGKEQYNQQGIVETRPQILRLDWANDGIAMVRVRWPYIDKAGRERGDEQSTYTLRRDEGGDLKIRAVVMHGVSGPH